MKVNIIEWLIINYNFNKKLLKEEVTHSFKYKNLGTYNNKKFINDIKGLDKVINVIDRLFIWQHANKNFSIPFANIDKDWRNFSKINNLNITDVYYDFNFFILKKLKINFEGE